LKIGFERSLIHRSFANSNREAGMIFLRSVLNMAVGKSQSMLLLCSGQNKKPQEPTPALSNLPTPPRKQSAEDFYGPKAPILELACRTKRQ